MHTLMPLYMYYGMLCNVMHNTRDAQHGVDLDHLLTHYLHLRISGSRDLGIYLISYSVPPHLLYSLC